MADPIGVVSLAITLIQGAYKAYGIHKLTEAFGNDFRRLQRRFDTQIGLLRIQAYRLRQATLLGLTGTSTDEKEWLSHIHGLVLEIKLNMETCQEIAEKYLGDLTPSSQPDGSQVTLKDPKTTTADLELSHTKEPVSEPRNKRRWRFLGKSGRKKVEELGKQKERPLDADEKPMYKSEKITAVTTIPPQILNETELDQKQKVEEDVSASLQGQTKYRSKLRWVTEDKQTYLENLQLISEDVGYLRIYVDTYIQPPDTTSNANAATGQLSRLPTDRARAIIASGNHVGRHQHGLVEQHSQAPGGDEQLEWLENSLFSCQEAFRQLRLDMRSDFSLKLCYDHRHTWRQFRPHRGVSARKDSILFILHTEPKRLSPEGFVLVIDTPGIQSCEKRCLEKISVGRHLRYRIQKGDIIEEIASSMDLDRTQKDEYTCLGSVKMNLTRPFVVPEDLVPISLRDKGKQALKASTSSENLHRGRDTYLIGPEDEFSETESLDGAFIEEKSQGEPTANGLVQKQDMESTLTETEYRILQRPMLYHVYQDRKSRWTPYKTLDKLLEEDKFRDHKFADSHLRLALLVTSNYVSLGASGQACIFRPVDCIYYTPTDGTSTLTHEEIILSPYIRISHDNAKQPTGLASGITSTKRIALLELGLLLYQIGSWRTLAYGHPDGLLGMVKDAVTNLAAVTNHTGHLLASLTHYCLTDQGFSTKRLSMGIHVSRIHEWPRYGNEDTYRALRAYLQSSQSDPRAKAVPTLILMNHRPVNEVLEICHFVLRPLEAALYNIGLLESKLEDGGSSTSKRRPNHLTMHKRHVDVETLYYYNIPYEWDPTDPDRFIILRDMDQRDLESLWKHTHRLRGSATTKKPPYNEPDGKHTSASDAEVDDEESDGPRFFRSRTFDGPDVPRRSVDSD
ncbi:hypothetical protein GT037_000081 [Alternaria burnsii]|uniref:Prion-inhibition and propagation HeLo domain-containing protein n=1 Tax=Alternaria burnsii TaxID=1187904 RepID=A0A8H7BBL5_9PLEO|nr:uncharacterized protein GT037_000081 [Alternaria burnsii]KAF7681105.1 hypothetical protein GT037_000081 [Alternaria burnsii]